MLLRWTSWNHPTDVDHHLDSWLARRGRTLTPLESNTHAEEPTIWQPAVDVHEDAERILLVADLPGLEQSNVNISVEKNVLSIRGERQPEITERPGVQRNERTHGAFSRTFTLPPTIDLDQVTAEMKAGVLRVTLPKKPETKPRQIKVNAAS
ncbi:MAG: Hsp20/alpha crystallin family protein [Polyangia bacterium]